MRFQQTLIPALILTLAASAPGAAASESVDKGREIFNKNRQAVVTVRVVRKSGNRETPQEITGTVIDASGLTVLALSACDPAEINRRLNEEFRGESEITDLKILSDDGELPAEIVLRDKDLDLAFIRPKTKPSAPMAAVDLTQSGPAQVLDDIVALNRLNKAASRAYSVSIEHISAVVQKPRTFYIPDSTMSATTLGSPAFLTNGKILGVFVLRAVNAAGSDYRENLTSVIVPAEDVLKGAKQAPQAKGDSEKKEEPKESKDSKEPAAAEKK